MITNNNQLVDELKNNVISSIQNDPSFISQLLSSLNSPFDINNLIGRWQQNSITNITLEISQTFDWTLIGPSPGNWIGYQGSGIEALDNKEFVFYKTSATYPNAKVVHLTGKFFESKILVTLNDAQIPGNTPSRMLLMEKLP